MKNKKAELFKFIELKKQRSSNRKPRYATRKLNIGLVSCMLGFSIIISPTEAKADSGQEIAAVEENVTGIATGTEKETAGDNTDGTVSQDPVVNPSGNQTLELKQKNEAHEQNVEENPNKVTKKSKTEKTNTPELDKEKQNVEVNTDKKAEAPQKVEEKSVSASIASGLAYTVDDEGKVSAPSAMSAIENLSELKNVKSVDWLTEPKGESTATLVITYEIDGEERKEEHTVSIDTSAIEEYEAKKIQAEADANNSEKPEIGEERIPESVNQQANPADPKKGETIIKAKLEAEGINGQPFDYKGIFGNNPETKATLVTDNGDISMDINPDTGEVTFNGVFKQEDVKNKDIWVEFNGQKIKGKLIVNESDGVIDQANATTTYTIKLYQVRNTDIVVETKDEKGNTASNPDSKKTGGSVKVKGNNKDLAEVEIPTDNKETKTVDPKNDGQINSKNKDDINAGLTFEIEGQENGFLVDKEKNKVYKSGEIKPDENGLDPTKIEFTEKPLVDSVKDRSKDTDYVKVEFVVGEKGQTPSVTTQYVIKGVNHGGRIAAPADPQGKKGYTFARWSEAVQPVYNADARHEAL